MRLKQYRTANRLFIIAIVLVLLVPALTLPLLPDPLTPVAASPDTKPGEACRHCQPEADQPGEEQCPIMRPSPEEKLRWLESHRRAPQVQLPKILAATLEKAPGGSFSLLDHLTYVPSERYQGSCGNCWVWAGTGIMEVALSVQNGIKDRLSIQYFNSKYNDGKGTRWACCGGWLQDFAAFYAEEKKAVPWSNTNAAYADASRSCQHFSTSVPASSIATSPSYVINSITAETIPTFGLPKEQAIANIKAVLHQNRAVWFAFFLADGNDVQQFRNFWLYQPESAVWDPSYTCNKAYSPATGGGHAVLCIGYNDEDPNNRYWVMVNSWGAPPNRPNGIFLVSMDMDYSCSHQGGLGGQAFFWETLDIAFQHSIPNVTGSYQVTGNIRFYDWRCNKDVTTTGGTLYITSQDRHKIEGYWQPDVVPEGWPTLTPVKGFVGSFHREDGKVKNTPRISLVLEAGTYCQYPQGSYVTYVLNGKIKWDKKLDTVKSIKGTIYGWGEYGTDDPDDPGKPSRGQFGGKFTATPVDGTTLPQGSVALPPVPETSPTDTVEIVVPNIKGDYPVTCSIKFFDWKCNKYDPVTGGTLHITTQGGHKIEGYWEPDVIPQGWPALVPVKGYVGPLVKIDGKVKNTPRLSLILEAGNYCQYPSSSYVTYVLNAKIKWDKKTDDVKSIKGTIYGWGEWGNPFDDASPTMGQFEGKFTAIPPSP